MKANTEKYRCLIIEDEPLAAEILSTFIGMDNKLELVEVCSDAIHGSAVLKRESIDLLFLDLHLPVLKGFDFLKKLENPPAVVVTTAYHEYAAEGFDLDVLDYLLKPIPLQRFQKAVGKFKQFIKTQEALLEFGEREFIVVSIAKKQHKIYLNDIFYIESFREYIVIHTKTDDIKVKMPISKIENMLDVSKFKRVHKSYIISLEKIEITSSAEVTVNSTKIPVGRSYGLIG
ncbi:LytTR family DNA-binding domain-containing protein [Flavobacterium sp. H122]|uniref:LytR/AlgR family response regulator transcription factor n=1 Tax=Flavobacterium sp. H122 TaxID=2529860 RepID=UPI0010AA1F35|nr:response regulator [Flavobacterium sp. H122]